MAFGYLPKGSSTRVEQTFAAACWLLVSGVRFDAKKRKLINTTE